jgi:hypothetical protein
LTVPPTISITERGIDVGAREMKTRRFCVASCGSVLCWVAVLAINKCLRRWLGDQESRLGGSSKGASTPGCGSEDIVHKPHELTTSSPIEPKTRRPPRRSRRRPKEVLVCLLARDSGSTAWLQSPMSHANKRTDPNCRERPQPVGWEVLQGAAK